MSHKKKKESRRRKLRFLKKIIDLGFFLLFALIITFVLNTYVVERCQVHNHSMEPTLTEGNIVLIDKLTYRRREPKRYEIVTVKNQGDKDDLIKRIIGLPGETIRIVQGNIYIDDIKIDDIDGLIQPFEAGTAEEGLKLGSDEYFVIGDNREVSIDSRDASIGPVKLENIIGKTFIRIKPLSKLIIR